MLRLYGIAAACLCSLLVAALGDGVGFCTGDAPQYTGYLPAGPEADYFYYFAESRSASPRSDPLVLWLTGGPGCSSVLALLMENGPCKVERRTANGDWLLTQNPWSWNEVANVLWVDQPVGVGYSNPGDDLVSTERQVGERMFSFLQNFYAKFPHLLDVPLFVTGESYGGHYVPVVAARVVLGQGQGVGIVRGIAIGNGLVAPTIQFASKPIMAYTGGAGGSLNGGVIDRETFLAMERNLSTCEAEILKCRRTPKPMNCLVSMAVCMMTEVVPVAQNTGLNPYDLRKPCATKRNSSDPSSGMCYDVKTEIAFLNDPATKRSLGVPQSRAWEPCNMTSTIPFILSGDELMSYRGTVIDLLSSGVEVLVYAGDCDFMVDWLGCRAWVQELPWAHHQEFVQAPPEPIKWGNKTVAVKQSAHGLTFIQVHNAGHLVPMDQPRLSLAMIRGMIDAASAKMQYSSVSDLSSAQESSTATSLVLIGVASVVVASLAVRAWRVQSADARPGYFVMA